jgi:TRAP-type C4-dicarboxylate transport system substrate-binding protein
MEEFKGKRLRVPSGPIRDLALALGATPDGTPPTEWAESLQKGTLAGVFTDYGGAGVAFRIGPVVKYATELYVYAGTFCICMNQKSYDGLPAAVRKDLDDTVAKKGVDVGKAFDYLDDVGKGIMMKEGTQPIILAPEEKAKLEKIAAKVVEDSLDALEKKKIPAREIHTVMKRLAAKHEPTSRNFWR